MFELTDKVKKRFDIQLKKIYVGKSAMKNARPELNQVHYTKNGHVEITNSHVAVRISNVHDLPDSDEKYPDMDKIFRIPDENRSVELKVKDFKELEDHLNVLYRNNVEEVQVTIDKYGIQIVEHPKSNEPNETFVESGIISALDTKEEFIFGMNSRYLHNALNFFRLIGANDITLHLADNHLRPLNITSGNLHYIVMPVRLGG